MARKENHTMPTRKLTVVTFSDQTGHYFYHIEVDQSVIDAGDEALDAHIPYREEYEWSTAVFDGHIFPIPGLGQVEPARRTTP